MPTQSNKQSQNVKVVINNNTPAPPRRRRRRPAAPPEDAEVPMPYAPSKEHAKGVSAYPNRPMTFAPSVQLIQTDNGGGRIPAYFENQLTNQATTLEQMRRQMEEELMGVREEMYGYAQNPDDIARIDRNIAELRGQLEALQQPAQPPAPPFEPPPQAPPAPPEPPREIQIPIIPQAPPEVNQPPPMNPPMYNMNLPNPLNRVFVYDPRAIPILPHIQLPRVNLGIDALIPPLEVRMADPLPQIDLPMADARPQLPPQPQPPPNPNLLQLPPPQQQAPNRPANKRQRQAPPPPPEPQPQPEANEPVRVYTKYQYEIAREKVIDLFYQRSTARGKQKNDIRLRILDVGRKVGIVSNNIATVRRKLEKIVKGHAI